MTDYTRAVRQRPKIMLPLKTHNISRISVYMQTNRIAQVIRYTALFVNVHNTMYNTHTHRIYSYNFYIFIYLCENIIFSPRIR